MQKTVNSDDLSLIKQYIDSYIKTPEDTNIEGLINDSDIYDFYLKNQSVIDNILLKKEWYDISPSEKNVFSVYDYIITSTKSAIYDLMVELQKNLTMRNI